MAFTFPKAPRVNVGDAITAKEWIALANAANARERSGLGDFHKRSIFWEANGWRQVRNSDEFGAMPSQAEFFDLYAQIYPEYDDSTWPIAGPGEPGGANVVSPRMGFAYGIEAADFSGEQIRIGEPNFQLWLGGGPPATLEEWWTLGKVQRGAMDPVTGNQNAPAIAAAHSAEFLTYNGSRTPYGQGWGGYFPLPLELMSDCGDTDDDGLGIASYEIKFTALRPDVSTAGFHGTVGSSGGLPTITYAGSCPRGTLYTAAGHVWDMARFPEQTYVFVFDGGSSVNVDVFQASDWIEGPYTGEGNLYRRGGAHISHDIHDFVAAFRGTPAQRDPDTFDITKLAFSFQEFHTRQYHLAPNYAYMIGPELVPAYPTAKLSGNGIIKLGKSLLFDPATGGKTYNYHKGFVFTGCFAKATKLTQPVFLEVLSGDTRIAWLTLAPDSNGDAQTLRFLPDAVTPAPLKVRLASDAFFDGTGEIYFEANEVLAYKPDHWDAYLLLRSSATLGGFEFDGPNLDGAGIDQTAANQFYKNYATLGCVVNTNTAGIRDIGEPVNGTPVYDAARRMTMDCARIVRRQEFLTYDYDALGRPRLRFKRYAFGKHNTRADLFRGIAPSFEPVTKIAEGVQYVVRSHTGGTVDYAGSRYAMNQKFKGIAKIKTFEAHGDAIVLEYEGIKPDADKGSWSNEWVMSMETHVYHPSPTSLWKPEIYADWFIFGDRCAFYAYNLPFARFADTPSNPSGDCGGPLCTELHLSPEMPSGMRYAEGLNSTASVDFCKSCQIFVAPYELASATVEFVAGGDDIVTLIFKTPFQRDASAPTSWSQDATTWSAGDLAAVRAEVHRTDDNALREYILLQQRGIHGSWKVGDGAYVQNGGINGVQSIPDNPMGSIMPRFFFTALMKKPYEDGNSTSQSWDTRVISDELRKLERKIWAWSEGCVDGEGTLDHQCNSGIYTYDFFFENLCFRAFGGTHLSDFRTGHGAMTNTEVTARLFNNAAACLDLMNMFRIHNIMSFEARVKSYQTTIDVAPDWGSGACPDNAAVAAIHDGTPPSPALTSTGGWGPPPGGFTADASGSLSLCGPGATGSQDLGFTGSKTEIEYRYVANGNFNYAIPPNVQALIDNLNVGVIGLVTTTTSIPRKRTTTDFNETGCSGPSLGAGAFWDGGAGSGYTWDAFGTTDGPTCVLLTNGLFSAGEPPAGSFAVCSYPDASSGSGFSQGHVGTVVQKNFTLLSESDSAVIVVPIV